jgi:hypothetical protein
MNFEQWLTQRGLSQSTIKKYAGALHGPLSSWALEHKLLSGPLSLMESPTEFDKVATQIAQLPIFQERDKRGHNMYSSALAQFRDYLRSSNEEQDTEPIGSDLNADIEAVLLDQQTTTTEKLELVKARVGQGKFRDQLKAHWQKCAVTGYQDLDLLIASHIKPWRACDNSERLNPFNGLLLLPNLDRAFDKGFLTFDSTGMLLTSPMLLHPERLGIVPGMRAELQPAHQEFMQFHRMHVFKIDRR